MLKFSNSPFRYTCYMRTRLDLAVAVVLEVAVVLAQAWLGFSSPSSSYLRSFA